MKRQRPDSLHEQGIGDVPLPAPIKAVLGNLDQELGRVIQLLRPLAVLSENAYQLVRLAAESAALLATLAGRTERYH
ncbi:hypothetical protein OPW41_12125 [Vibrio europaeus]|uniref:Uncharacterized protein n=2 Tax=Vibrio oreintalis group TaxID=1891919 RepID=A0AAE7B067_9VIBR|nr:MULTISPECIES: hypothetical protein [Vibrio oreintalis group]MDC5721899.1 hypothetical protein [Vibrio europaeus]MDC5758287.1 hypothetical protein [Vibrio europaeus]MDC5776563.1 hypothetical protein [Vibrio europaeus]MDC5795578.1 hypothetical protein [Vibrio europaeus]MDC5801521.1 hypothetical protein [Vibrio europaeus]